MRSSSSRILGSATFALALAMRVGLSAAASGPQPQQRSLLLHAGETYVIDGLQPDSSPSYRVIDNPNALLPNTDTPGKLVLVGAENGRWAIDVKRADGTPVSYDVVVKAIANWNAPLRPGVAPRDD